MGAILKWIHLSDIHYNFNNYPSLRMRDLLLKYIEEICKGDIYNFMIITGDILYKGKNYNGTVVEFIDKMLETSKIEKGNLYIVPGNHDLKRSKPREHMINGIIYDDTPNDYFEFDKETECVLLDAQKTFFEFYKKVKEENYPKDKIHFVKKTPEYNILHINTCLTSGINNEEGTLKVGLTRLFESLKEINGDKDCINIAIGHHGIDCFSENEQTKIMNSLIDYGIDIYLCGHIHKPKYFFDYNNYRNLPMFASGANIVDGYATASFITGEIDLEEKKAKIVYHSWNDEIERWNIDLNVGRRITKGSLNFNLDRFVVENDLESELYLSSNLDEDDFKRFIIEFNNYIEFNDIHELEFIPKDINIKFENMRCNRSIRKQYDKFSEYFPVVNEIMDNPNYIDLETKLIIPNVIVEEYNNVFDDFPTGTKIIEAIASNILDRYKNKINYPESRLKVYIKILVYWSIYECDIFDDVKE